MIVPSKVTEDNSKWEMFSMKYDLIIKNGHVFAPQDLGIVDVAIKGGKIAALGDFDTEDAESVIDASGKLIFPGLVETHAHMLLPSWDRDKKRFLYRYCCWGAGGVTTLVILLIKRRVNCPWSEFRRRMEQATGRNVWWIIVFIVP